MNSEKERNRKLPIASYPAEISQVIRAVGRVWARSELRPRISENVKRHWDDLIEEWAESSMPLVIRKSGGVRGSEVLHESGRHVIIADNSPAQWAFTRAYQEQLYTLTDIENQLSTCSIPFAFATKTSEKSQMKYSRTLSAADNVNKSGWKLCHIREVGLGTKDLVTRIRLGELKEKFRFLMKPSNQFLVPIKWSGLGEIDEFIEEIKKVELAV